MKTAAANRLACSELIRRRRRWPALAAMTLALTHHPVTAAEVSLPNVFSSGQRASATQVNENFNAVEAGVDDNARKIAELQSQVLALQSPQRKPLSVYVAGTRVGTLFQPDSNVVGVSNTGYLFSLNTLRADIDVSVFPEGTLVAAGTLYTQSNCLGTKYFSPDATQFSYRWRQGVVFAAFDPQDNVKAYMAKGDPQPLLIRSYRYRTSLIDLSACINTSEPFTARLVIRADPNDEAVTGIKSEITGIIEIRP